MCRKKFWDHNHFGSRNSTFEIWAQEIPESRLSSKRQSDTLCVKLLKFFKSPYLSNSCIERFCNRLVGHLTNDLFAPFMIEVSNFVLSVLACRLCFFHHILPCLMPIMIGQSSVFSVMPKFIYIFLFRIRLT